MITQELLNRINKEDKYSLCYLLDSITYNSLNTVFYNHLKKKEVKEELINLIKDEKYFNRLVKLTTYKEFAIQ